MSMVWMCAPVLIAAKWAMTGSRSMPMACAGCGEGLRSPPMPQQRSAMTAGAFDRLSPRLAR